MNQPIVTIIQALPVLPTCARGFGSNKKEEELMQTTDRFSRSGGQESRCMFTRTSIISPAFPMTVVPDSPVYLKFMQMFHWGQPVGNCIFGEPGSMFTRLVRVGCSFLACQGELVKFQTCLKFLRPLLTIVCNPNFTHLATGLSVNLTACWLHFQASLYHFQACPYHFQAYHNRKPACLLQLITSHLQVLSSMM